MEVSEIYIQITEKDTVTERLTCGSIDGKNLQILGNIFVASIVGVPGNLLTLHKSRIVFSQAN